MKAETIIRVAIVAAGVAAMPFASFAEAVTDTDDVTAVVVGWQRAQEALDEQLEAEPVSVREYPGLGGTGTYYVVTLEGGGYVVTSGDTSLEPVLAYSKTGTWVDDVKRNPLMAMLEIDIAAATTLTGTTGVSPVGGRRLAASSSTAETAVVPVNGQDARSPSEANAAKWARYKAGASQKGGIRLGASAPSSDLRVAALLQSAWSQSGNGENYYTPGASTAGNPGFVCGCVATMCAQIMRYWEWPKGTNITAIANYTGTVTYGKDDAAVSTEWDLEGGYYRTKTATTKTSWTSYSWPAFGGTYDWANMPLTFTYGTTTAQKKAIGHLTRDCGIACGMNYADGGSGAPGPGFAHRAVDQFAYTSGKCVNGWNDANRDALLASLDAGIPCGFCIYGDGGHAVVADGYGYSGGTLYIHFNYGWGSTGPSDWYTPPNVGTFTSVGEIIFNVYPPSVSKHDRTIVSGRVLSGTTAQSSVTVTATNRETGFSTNVTSNSKGIYSFMLPRGYYSFTATKSGSSAKVEADVKLGIAGTGSNAKSGNIHGLDLNLGTAVTAPAVSLTHRWSFSGNLNDSVGSSTATKIGSNVNLVDGKAVCTGNGAGQGSLNLGSNLLDTDGATIEIWAANDEVKSGSRIFEYGVDTGHYFMMAWTKSTDLYVDCAEAFSDGANNIYDGALAPFTLGRQYHISVTFERQGDGTTKVRATRRDAASGAIQRVAVYSVTNGIHTFSSPILRLGRSFQGNADARATYDEVRVWQGVLSDAQLKASALAGPDANLSTLPWNASAVRYVAKAIWTGGTPSSASDFANSANWSCTDQNGDAITGVPDHRSVVIIPNGSTAFTIPEGFTPNWRKLQIGSEGKATAQWGKKTYTQTSVSAQLDPTSADYTLQGDANVDELARAVAPSVQDAPAGLSGKQFRYDGWVYVTAAQAGRWAVSAYADDYAAFRLDDEWLAFTVSGAARTSVVDVPKGWHRFTLIIGDWYGGFGGSGMTTDHSCAAPVTVSIDGGNNIAFTSSNFQFGAPDRTAPVVTLAGDCDWSGVGEVSLDSGAELDLNGHSLTIDTVESSFLGAKIKNSSATPANILLTNGTGVDRSNIAFEGDISVGYASIEQRIGNEAALWLDASDTSTLTINGSGEVTRWNSRVGSNYAKQSTHYQGVAMPYPRYDATTYGIPTVDFGEAKTDGGWAGANLGMDLRLNETVPTKTVFWVARMKDAGNVAWMGINGFDTPFRRGGDGQYAMLPNAKFANFWNGQDVVADMANDHPPADVFCVYSAQMDDSATYNAEYLASQCLGLHSGGKQLSELIIFNHALSNDDRIEVTQYLQRKWAKSHTAPIAHRWSFNGTTDSENLTDSIGGVVGKKQYHPTTTTTSDGGTVNWSNGKAVLQGGGGTGHLNLGQGVLGSGDAVTLELWVTKDSNASGWAYYFAYNKPDTKNLISLSANTGNTSSNNRNLIQTALYGTAFADGELTYLPTGGTYHYSLTLQANGNGGTIMRWMARDAESGALVGDVTKTASSWTLAANASDWSLTLGDNPWVNSTYDNPSSYDEVRVWNGILGDEQLRVNAIMGPDASPDAAVTSSDGFALATNATFQVDGDYSTDGAVILGEGSKLQFNGPYVFTARGGINIPSGELADYVVADTSLYNVIAQDGVITVTSKAGSASWAGAGRAGDVTDPNNWDCRDGFGNAMPGELPSAATAVTVSGTGINLQAPVGTTLQCATFTVRDCTFAADCDWRGLPVTPSINGTVDLNGHNLRLNHLSAGGGAALANSGVGVCGVMFDATAGNYNESSYVDGLANLGTSENAHIIILNYPGDSVSALAIGNTANKWTEVRMANGTFSSSANPTAVDNVANAHGILTVDGATVTLNSLKVQGQNNIAGSGTVNVKSGNLTMTGWTDAGNGSGSATFNQSGGTVTSEGNFWFGRQYNGVATYNMTGGSTFTATGSWGLGVSTGKGYFNQSGGTLNLNSTSDSNGAFFGYDSSSVAKYVQTGGTVNAKPNVLLGRAGTGELDIGGSFTMNTAGKGVTMGSNGGTGTLTLREGGVLTTSFLKKGSGTAHATFAGGKIVAKDASNASTFISGIGDVTYAAGGLTVDTAGYNVSMANNTVANATAGSALVKQGAGTLTIDSLPPVRNVSIDAGTLKLLSDGAGHPSVNAAAGNEYTASPSSAVLLNDYLLHRWNFNGQCYDLIGTNNAVFKGTSTYSYQNGNTEIKIPGGGRGTGWLDCGSNIIPAELGDTPFTIEMWVKVHSLHNWDQWFAFGNSSNPAGTGGCLTGLILAPKSGAGLYPSFRAVGAKTSNNVAVGSGNLTANKEYHVAAVVTPTGGSTATVTIYIEDPSGEEEIRVKSENVTNWSTATIVQDNFWLGHSHWDDQDAAASYNEVRVWAAALSQAQVEANGTLGADALPVLSDRSAINMAERMDIASGATLDITELTLTLPVLKGSGTVRGGMLNITDSLVVNLADCIAGNCITASGIINFTGAKLVFEDPEVLETHKGAIWLVRPAQGGSVSFVGTPECVPALPNGWTISLTGTGVKLTKSGFAIRLR